MLVPVTTATLGVSLLSQINRDPFTKARRSLRRLVRSMLGVSRLIKTTPPPHPSSDTVGSSRRSLVGGISVCVWSHGPKTHTEKTGV